MVADAALSPHFSREEITQALIGVLDASILILPEASYAVEFKGRIETVRRMFAEGGLLEDKIRQYLGFAHKMVAGGQAWAVPEELKSAYREADIMDQAKKICTALLDGALADLRSGRAGNAEFKATMDQAGAFAIKNLPPASGIGARPPV
jgi:hypothetical protein